MRISISKKSIWGFYNLGSLQYVNFLKKSKFHIVKIT